METIHVEAVIAPDGKMRLEVPCSSPPGPAEVVVVIHPTATGGRTRRFSEFYGVAKDIGDVEDAQAFVNRLRDECER